jgi:hypothetical protein
MNNAPPCVKQPLLLSYKGKVKEKRKPQQLPGGQPPPSLPLNQERHAPIKNYIYKPAAGNSEKQQGQGGKQKYINK